MRLRGPAAALAVAIGLAAPGAADAQPRAATGRACTGGMVEGTVPHGTTHCVACRAARRTSVFRCLDGQWVMVQQCAPREEVPRCDR